MTSFVYATMNVGSPVDLRLITCGPDDFAVSLMSTQLNPDAKKAEIMGIDRGTGKYAMFDVGFSIGGTYIASYGVLIRGHGYGSSIWWRWRTALQGTLDWTGDRDQHDVTVSVGLKKYIFSIQGDSSFLGSDDLLINLRSAN